MQRSGVVLAPATGGRCSPSFPSPLPASPSNVGKTSPSSSCGKNGGHALNQHQNQKQTRCPTKVNKRATVFDPRRGSRGPGSPHPRPAAGLLLTPRLRSAPPRGLAARLACSGSIGMHAGCGVRSRVRIPFIRITGSPHGTTAYRLESRSAAGAEGVSAVVPRA